MNRKRVRKALAAEFLASSAFQSVFDHLGKDFQGESPVCTVENGPVRLTSTPSDPSDLYLVVGVWIRRDDALSAQQAEDSLDDLLTVVEDVVLNKFNGSFETQSLPDYELIGGHDYRVEFHFVRLIDWDS